MAGQQLGEYLKNVRSLQRLLEKWKIDYADRRDCQEMLEKLAHNAELTMSRRRILLSDHLRYYLCCCVCATPAGERRLQSEAAENMTPGWKPHSVKHELAGLLVCWVCVQDARVLGRAPETVPIRLGLLEDLARSRHAIGPPWDRALLQMDPDARIKLHEIVARYRELDPQNPDRAEESLMDGAEDYWAKKISEAKAAKDKKGTTP